MTMLESLRAEITAANEAYWKKATPIMSDVAYDKKLNELKKLSPNDPLLNVVGNDDIAGKKVKHEKHMFSLGKVYSWAELVDWVKKVARTPAEKFRLSTKFDGMSVEVNSDGRLITRGNGDVGTDVTHIRPLINFSIPESERRSYFEAFIHGGKVKRLVGEFLVNENVFKQLKKFVEFKEYKTPRNLAAAFLSLKPGHPLLTILQKMRSNCPEWVYHQFHELEASAEELFGQGAETRFVDQLRNWNNYPCDGIVIRLADEAYSESLGETSHHPRGAMALKFEEETADVEVKRIVWQVGEMHVTPVAEFDPVYLDGVEVSRATIHGKDFLVSNNVCVGSTVTIIRQGGVIPKIIRVETPAGLKCVVPTVCPDCGQPLREEGAFLSCTNDECSSRIACKIVRGLSVFGLKGVGPALALKVIGEMYIPDIMTWAQEMVELKASPELWNEKWLKRQTKFTASELTTLMRLTELMDQGVTASDLLKSVCIPKVGDMFVTAINKYAGGVENLMKVVPVDGMYDYLVDHPGVNLDALTSFMIWMERYHEDFVQYMNLFKILPEPTESDGVGGAEGVVCMTGAGPKPRHELELLAKQKGFAVTDNANLCSVLVCADPNSGSSKITKAKAKGKLIMTYEEFFK